MEEKGGKGDPRDEEEEVRRKEGRIALGARLPSFRNSRQADDQSMNLRVRRRVHRMVSSYEEASAMLR